MHDFLFKLPLHVDVTHEAEFGAVFNNQALIVRLMRTVTGSAVACGRGTMDVLILYFVRMARETKVFDGLGKELRLCRVVRIMAGRAQPVFYGRMYMFQVAETRMALITQIRRLLGEFERLFICLRMRSNDRLVAGIAGFRCRMDGFSFKQARVAFLGHTALCCRRPRVSEGQAKKKKDNQEDYICFFYGIHDKIHNALLI